MNGYPYNNSYDGGIGEQGDGGDGGNVMILGQEAMHTSSAFGGQSLDEIVNQNAKVIRRQSLPHQYGGNTQNAMDQTLRRISMMEYGSASPNSPLGAFQYEPGSVMEQSGLMSGNGTPAHNQHSRTPSHRRQPQGDLAINTSYANSQAYNNIASNSAYQSPAHPQSGYDVAMDSPYLDTGLGMQMNYEIDQNMANPSGADMSRMNLFTQPQFNQTMMASPIQQGGSHGTPHTVHGQSLSSGGGSGMNTQYSGHSGSTDTARHVSRQHSLAAAEHASSPSQAAAMPNIKPSISATGLGFLHEPFQGQPQHPPPGSQQDRGIGNASQQYDGVNGPLPLSMNNYNPNNQGFDWEAGEGGWPSTMVGRPHMTTSYSNAYSTSGFDMLGVLMRVASRPNPEINIGSVDLSCSFVVCDAEKDDFPIVYCSDNFERLTGYTKHMILGRNCRFLQSPDGNVAPGNRRKYVDDDSVLYLKNMINLRREAQISLINYRRGGQPFMNLLTMIPIAWETEQVKYFVGFQVDLVEQPNAVTNKNPDGSYSINYQRGMTMPRYVLNAPTPTPRSELGQTVPRDDVSTILSTIGNGESEYAKRMWDKVLLENTDDVVHVLSLKGLFQWVSPSAARILEYEPTELIGTALSSVCHPSDIVPVTRELKDTSTGAAVNVVFRIRRKNNGYMWFEGHGSLHTELGKGRKSIILVGRERPVYALSKKGIDENGGIGENELWTKMSTSGMFLFVASNVRQLLDRQPEELIGISIQTLMRADSKTEFGRILEHARTGKTASVKHEMINRRGQVMSAYTTLYPGDAIEGQKPTFIVAQTRLIKFSRGAPAPRAQHLSAKPDRASPDSAQSAALSTQQVPQDGQAGSSEQPAAPPGAANRYVTTDGSAATYAGQNGLLIGHQDASLASEDNLFDELKTTKSSSWQYEIRQLEKRNRMLAEEVQSLLAAKKKRKRRRGKDQQKDCANCHTRVTPEWRRGPSGQRDLCNSCGLRWAKLNGRVSPRTSSQHSVHSAGGASDKASKASESPVAQHQQQQQQQQTFIKTESPTQMPGPSSSSAAAAAAGVEVRDLAYAFPSSKSAGDGPAASHAASMEGASGVPAKIDEDSDEPD